MSELSMASNELSFLKRIDLVIEGVKYSFDDYGFLNSRLILNNFMQGDINRLLILHPTGVFLTILASTVIPLALAKYDIEKASRDITDHLRIGDKVMVDGCLGEVSDIITETFGKQYVVVRFNDMNLHIPFERAWRIQKYEGSAVNLHNYKYKPRKKVNKQKAILCNILNLEEVEVPPTLYSKTLIVSEKNLFISNIANVQLGGAAYTTVFPTGYFKNNSEFERIGTDPLQRRPLVCIVSSLAVAYEIVENDPSVKAVIVNDLKKLRGNYIYLERMQEKSVNVLLLQELHKFEEEDIEKLVGMGLRIFHWSFEKVKNLNLFCDSGMNKCNSLVGRIQRNLLRIADPMRDYVVIQDEVAELERQVKGELEAIRLVELESDYKIPFIARTYDGLLSLRAMPIPFNDPSVGQGYLDYFGKLIQDLTDLKTNIGFETNNDTLKSIELVVENMERLIIMQLV